MKHLKTETVDTVETKETVVAGDVQEVIDARAEAKENEVAPGTIEVPLDNGTTSFSNSETVKVTDSDEETVLVPAPASPATSEVIPGVWVDEIETPVVVRETRIIDERLTRASADMYLERIKLSNPTKYAAKKIELETRLAASEAKAAANTATRIASEKAEAKEAKEVKVGNTSKIESENN